MARTARRPSSSAAGCALAGASLGVTSAARTFHPPLLRGSSRARERRPRREHRRRAPRGRVVVRRRRRRSSSTCANRIGAESGGAGAVACGGSGAAACGSPWRARLAPAASSAVARGPAGPDHRAAAAAGDVSGSRACATIAVRSPVAASCWSATVKSAMLVEVSGRGSAVAEAAAAVRAWVRVTLSRRRRPMERALGGHRDRRADRRSHGAARRRHAPPAGCRHVPRHRHLGRQHRDPDGAGAGRARLRCRVLPGRAAVTDHRAPARVSRGRRVGAVGRARDQRGAALSRSPACSTIAARR